jgi:hypothetical protein
VCACLHGVKVCTFVLQRIITHAQSGWIYESLQILLENCFWIRIYLGLADNWIYSQILGFQPSTKCLWIPTLFPCPPNLDMLLHAVNCPSYQLHLHIWLVSNSQILSLLYLAASFLEYKEFTFFASYFLSLSLLPPLSTFTVAMYGPFASTQYLYCSSVRSFLPPLSTFTVAVCCPFDYPQLNSCLQSVRLLCSGSWPFPGPGSSSRSCPWFKLKINCSRRCWPRE